MAGGGGGTRPGTEKQCSHNLHNDPGGGGQGLGPRSNVLTTCTTIRGGGGETRPGTEKQCSHNLHNNPRVSSFLERAGK